MGWLTDIIKDKNIEPLHMALDVAGVTPLFGNIADLANAAIYWSKGENDNAKLSALAAIPGYGQGATGLKYAAKGAKDLPNLFKGGKVKQAQKGLEDATKGLKQAQKQASKGALKGNWSEVVSKGKEVQSKKEVLKSAQKGRAGVKDRLKAARDEIDNAKIGGESFIGKGANILLPAGKLDVKGLQPKSPNEETEKKPELPKDEGEETRPLIDDNLRDKPRPTPKGDGLGLGDGITKAIDTITTEVEAGVEEGKQLAEKAKKEQQDNYTKRAEITAEMDDLMTQDPDYFRKNRGAANVMFQKARKLGVTADQFNSYVRNNKTAAEARRRDIDRNEAQQFLTDKLNQSVTDPLGTLTARQKGYNREALLDPNNKMTAQQMTNTKLRQDALLKAKEDNEKNKPKTTSRTA